jgi:hypothetical protein
MAPCRRAATAFVVLALAAGAAAAATDVFQEYGLDRRSWADAFVHSLADGVLRAPGVPGKLKGVPPAQRAAVVQALGTAAKAFFGGAEFQARYRKEYDSSVPGDLRTPRSASEIEASSRAEMQKGLAEMEQSVKSLQGDARKQAEAAMAQVRAEMDRQAAALGKAAAQQAADEKARYEAAKKRPPDPNALSPDPKVSLRKSLGAFLQQTSGVDYAAETRDALRTRRFVKPEYEAKPAAWKTCYRAGREACDAARAFATGWLAELK